VRNRLKTNFGVCVLLVIVGCATSPIEKNLNLELAKSPFSFRANRGSVEEIQIPKDSRVEAQIYEWLSANSKNWKTTLITYAPNKVIRGQNFDLNFLSHCVVLNFSPRGSSRDWRQYWKPSDEKDSEFLKEVESELNP